LKSLPVGRRKVGRPRTTWCRMAEKERDEELGWKCWEETAATRKEWRRLVEALCAPKAQMG